MVGRLVRPIELKKGSGDIEYGVITLATRRSYRNKKGEYVTDFFNIPIFERHHLDNISKYTQKGSLIAVYGHLETNVVKDNNQHKVYTNIVPNHFEFLTKPKKINEVVDTNGLMNDVDYLNEIPNDLFNEF